MKAKTKTRTRNHVHRRSAVQIAKESGAELVPPQTVANHLGVTPRTVKNWAERGDIPVAFRRGKVIRFRLSDVLA